MGYRNEADSVPKFPWNMSLGAVADDSMLEDIGVLLLDTNLID